MMRKICWLAALVVLCGAGASALAAAALTPAAYRAELDRLIAGSDGLEQRPGDIEAVARSLPQSWRVEAGGRTFEIPCSGVRGDLEALRRRPNAPGGARLRARLRQLRDDLDAYETPPPDRRAERARLAAILARTEFADVHGPTWFERLKQRALAYLLDLLGSVLGLSSVPVISRFLIYGLLALALLAILFWVHRSLRAGAEPDSILPTTAPASATRWEVWLGDARAAAARGEWRDAVRLAYWAGISSLESRGLWPADRARTPREYLRLVPREDERRAPLASISTTFELVWYGRQEADAGTFSGAVADLERLGCRPQARASQLRFQA
jgi:Domain of unknown function (DUF4129)